MAAGVRASEGRAVHSKCTVGPRGFVKGGGGVGELGAREDPVLLEVRGEEASSSSAGFSSPPWPWSPGPLTLPPKVTIWLNSPCFALLLGKIKSFSLEWKKQ